MGVGTEKKRGGKVEERRGREKESWVLVEVGSLEKCP